MQRLGRFVHQTLRCFSSLQVELRGHYSADRMRSFNEYRNTVSMSRALLICLTLPFPCITILTMVDALPLAPPSGNSKESYMFWIRDSILVFFITWSVFEEMHINVPGLQMRSVHKLIPAIVATVATTTFKVACSYFIGFPVPFQLVLGIPVWLPTLAMTFAGFYGKILKRDRVLFTEVVAFTVASNCQALLTVVYPIYFYGYINMGPSGKKYYVILLPIIKILAKNVVSAAFGHRYDFLPEILIFNVDVFHSLYVSNSIQSSNSITTTLVIVAFDIVQALISISDIASLISRVNQLQSKLPADHPLKAASFVDIALQMIEESSEVQTRLATRRYTSALGVVTSQPANRGSIILTSSASWSENVFKFWRKRNSARVATNVEMPAAKKCSSPRQELLPKYMIPVDVLSLKERHVFVERTARVLFTAAFVILVEYAEVVIPIIYCTYTTAMFYLPNRAYYPTLKGLDEVDFKGKMMDILAYVTVELLSLLVIGYAIQRKLRISMLRLLSFVLDTNWRLVQTYLVLWIFFTVESSIEHSGTDFSFSFSWLKRKSTP